ncbi:DUF2516 family protein [Corynebacterium uberis]|uniref:DUF2516 family protein n=1 Tax=Corynebacterium TaxID=1716 RepID=UPI001D0A82C8|nr:MULTISPECIES: DUF2516 family protein [Corynebacterium]MCZ9309547.1 DUF2516 family protein [Corynebacterium sp. c6VSa_13]UDL74766.1 DUF2516 family protein [Corynebacterium uberis]UDL76887.1 DUF2516 family protein [Corynebacterium uberis]UDL79099.1 DUF2516 family protein [Corynebacterium uberis]UDL81302.1 DUF2516 family protein [Corynebacterium uberis]
MDRLDNYLFLLAAVAALVGALLIATTRADAFDAADRKSKWTWAGMLLAAAVACVFYPMTTLLAWVGIVVTGLYWFDVRPQIARLLGGQSGW